MILRNPENSQGERLCCWQFYDFSAQTPSLLDVHSVAPSSLFCPDSSSPVGRFMSQAQSFPQSSVRNKGHSKGLQCFIAVTFPFEAQILPSFLRQASF